MLVLSLNQPSAIFKGINQSFHFEQAKKTPHQAGFDSS